MVFYFGLDSLINGIRKNLDQDLSAALKKVHDIDNLQNIHEAYLFLIGNDEGDPVKIVQKVVSGDKHLSIQIIVPPKDVNQIKRTLQFSPFVGKNSSCITYNPEVNYTVVFKQAIERTRQKRSFNHASLAHQTMLERISLQGIKLRNLDAILEHAPIAVLVLNDDGTIIGANNRSRQMFSALHSVQVPLNKIFSEKQAAKIQQIIQEGGDTILHASDIDSSYEIMISKVNDGESRQAIVLVNDITERNEKDKRIQAILESLPQMAWTATPDGKANYYSKGWYSYTNQSMEEALGEGWMPVVHPDDVKLATIRWTAAVSKGKVFEHAVRLRKFNGEYRWHLSRAVPVYSDTRKILMWVGTSTDIHDQVLLTEELEKKVKERTRSLELMNAELEQFAHVSSHDLQEPLRKIHTFAQLVKDISYDSMSENSRRYLDKVLETSARMSRLLKDLLSFTRLDHKASIEKVDLTESIADIREDLELLIAQNKATIIVKNLPVIEARPSQVKQLFYNLINNSLKFKKPETPPIINISGRKMTEEELSSFPQLNSKQAHWEVVVKDNGIGFDQKYATQIFAIFQRLHSRVAYDGSGMGLAICKKIVSNHGGEIFACSSPEEGSQFHIILPASA